MADRFDPASNSIRLRNVLAHEAGHGIGIRHVESNNARFLMEPFINTSFDGPQSDDILAAQRLYGDALEDTGGGNDTSGTAVSLGPIAGNSSITVGTSGDTTVVSPLETDFLSIDDNSDTDFFSFSLPSSSTVNVTLDPVGPTYNQGPQGGSQSSFNTQALNDLRVEVIDSGGTTVLATANDNGAGGSELIGGVALGAGTYFVRVTGSLNAVQMYRLTVEHLKLAPPTATALLVNDGNSNRSGVRVLTIEFDEAVNVSGPSALVLFNHTTSLPVVVPGATLENNGTAAVTWNLNEFALPNGRYSAQLPAATVTSASSATNMGETVTFVFQKLTGDVSGDDLTNATDFIVVDANFDPLPGTAYRSGDTNGDGVVNATDFIVVDANFDPAGAGLGPALTFDFGDAPETGTAFPTTLANTGARHIIAGNTLLLGLGRDAEVDGQPDATATGDGADEDGVVISGNGGALETETAVAVDVTASGAGFLNAWIDFNQDGDWDDAGEQVFTDLPVVAGVNNLTTTAPAGAVVGTTIGRFRLTAAAGYSYFGLAPDGEVEDYQISVNNNSDTPLDRPLESPLNESVLTTTLRDRGPAQPIKRASRPASGLSRGLPPSASGVSRRSDAHSVPVNSEPLFLLVPQEALTRSSLLFAFSDRGEEQWRRRRA